MILRILADIKAATAALLGIESRASNMPRALFDIKELALASIRQNFAVGGRPTKWAPLKYPRKRGSIGSAIPLSDTGRLRASITGQLSQRSVTLGTNLRYARVHQFGGAIAIPEIRPRRRRALSWVTLGGQRVFAKKVGAHTVHIPARPFLVLQREDEVDFARVVEHHLLRGVR